MSRKYRKRKAGRNRAVSFSDAKNRKLPDPAKQAAILAGVRGEALDGYNNAAAFLGQSSPLISAGTFLRSGLTSNIRLLTTTYRECWLATRIIDTPADDMTRSWYTLTGKFRPEDLAGPADWSRCFVP